MYSFLPAMADKGIPLAKAFPKQHKSGVTPKYSEAPPNDHLKPETTSSNTSKVPYLLHNFLTPSKNPGLGWVVPY